MASSKVLAVIHIISLLLPTTLSQTVGNSPADPSIAECGPYLLPLAPCGPFVQGTVPFPALQCCINLRQLYAQQATCLCLLMNGSSLSAFPINTTLALQLPTLCTMQIDPSICSGILHNITISPIPLFISEKSSFLKMMMSVNYIVVASSWRNYSAAISTS